ncbi:MAG: hypothetical protein PCFJNLEI_00666 [Verrucomicrobiae bacterium]|nr:hypothetical protein [Verrucomicrobiae bacterium]
MENSTTKFQTEPYLIKRWEKVGRKSAFVAENLRAWKTWRRQTLITLKKLTGFDTMVQAKLSPVVTDNVTMDGYRRQRIEIQTEPAVIMPLYALVPEGKGPFPAVIAPHGHGSGGKYSVAGRRDIPELVETIANHNYDYGVQFVRAGFIVFCPDSRGFGERREKAAQGDLLAQSCQWLNNMGYPLGQTVTGMWAWDIHRLIDYVETRKDCVPGAIGCAGLSGGGLQTLWASALDERIRCAVVSGYFFGYKESLLERHTHCSCNYVPHLYEHVDMGDIAALIAPRPLLIETGNQDPLNGKSGLGNVLPQMRITTKAYRLLHAKDKLAHDIFEGPHRWNGVKAIPWMRKHLVGQNSSL